jgi:putative OPT family oligopeptide transporter
VFHGGLPWNFVFIGMAVAVAVIAGDVYLERKGSFFRMPVLAVAIGIYLPLELAVPVLAGGVIHQLLKNYHKRRGTAKDAVEVANRHGLLFASGLITGEALIGILLAVPIVITANPHVLVLLDEPLDTRAIIMGFMLLAGIAYWMYYAAKTKE